MQMQAVKCMQKDHVMVIGAGAAGQALIKEIINSKKLNTQVVCIIDDNPTKHGRVLEGITIVGDRYSIPEMAKKYKVDRIIYAIPEAAADDRKAILNICKDTGCRLQTVPGVYQLVNGEVSVSRLRNVEITDLLGRAQVQVNMDEIYSSIQGKNLAGDRRRRLHRKRALQTDRSISSKETDHL